MLDSPRILLTVGEPAGIGPDLIVQIAQQEFTANIVVIADKNTLLARAQQLNLPLILKDYHKAITTKKNKPGELCIIPISCPNIVRPGQLDIANVPHVLKSLSLAAKKCLSKEFNAIVTGPVHKGIINDAGISFQGHTEFFANYAKVQNVVMMLVAKKLRVALVTTHLPLAKVPTAITKDKIYNTLKILLHDLKYYFGIQQPHIFVCGLNPHAGENGHLGREEIDIIAPVIRQFKLQGEYIFGPLPADTIFTDPYLQQADAILTMYHDQGLPVLKHISFGHAVNVTLGLPFIRTSVDHGTALDIAGTGKSDSGSLQQAIKTAIAISSQCLSYHC